VASHGNASALTPGTLENRIWEKSWATLETRQAGPLQTTGLHQENGSAGYDFAPDSLLAAKTPPIRSNADLIQEIATRSENAIDGTGRFAGTEKHSYAKTLLDKYQGIYGNRGLQTETTWLNNAPATYGTKGAPRIDVWDSNLNWAYDYKFTIRPPALTPAQTQKIMTHGPPNLGGVTEINP